LIYGFVLDLVNYGLGLGGSGLDSITGYCVNDKLQAPVKFESIMPTYSQKLYQINSAENESIARRVP
jgi:hypothetical protein